MWHQQLRAMPWLLYGLPNDGWCNVAPMLLVIALTARCALLLRSVQGYGRRTASPTDGWVYPGSGATADSCPPTAPSAPQTAAAEGPGADGGLVAKAMPGGARPGEGGHGAGDEPGGVEEDPEAEFAGDDLERPPRDGPRVINVGIPGPGAQASAEGGWAASKEELALHVCRPLRSVVDQFMKEVLGRW